MHETSAQKRLRFVEEDQPPEQQEDKNQQDGATHTSNSDLAEKRRLWAQIAASDNPQKLVEELASLEKMHVRSAQKERRSRQRTKRLEEEVAVLSGKLRETQDSSVMWRQRAEGFQVQQGSSFQVFNSRGGGAVVPLEQQQQQQVPPGDHGTTGDRSFQVVPGSSFEGPHPRSRGPFQPSKPAGHRALERSVVQEYALAPAAVEEYRHSTDSFYRGGASSHQQPVYSTADIALALASSPSLGVGSSSSSQRARSGHHVVKAPPNRRGRGFRDDRLQIGNSLSPVVAGQSSSQGQVILSSPSPISAGGAISAEQARLLMLLEQHPPRQSYVESLETHLLRLLKVMDSRGGAPAAHHQSGSWAAQNELHSIAQVADRSFSSMEPQFTRVFSSSSSRGSPQLQDHSLFPARSEQDVANHSALGTTNHSALGGSSFSVGRVPRSTWEKCLENERRQALLQNPILFYEGGARSVPLPSTTSSSSCSEGEGFSQRPSSAGRYAGVKSVERGVKSLSCYGFGLEPPAGGKTASDEDMITLAAAHLQGPGGKKGTSTTGAEEVVLGRSEDVDLHDGDGFIIPPDGDGTMAPPFSAPPEMQQVVAEVVNDYPATEREGANASDESDSVENGLPPAKNSYEDERSSSSSTTNSGRKILDAGAARGTVTEAREEERTEHDKLFPFPGGSSCKGNPCSSTTSSSSSSVQVVHPPRAHIRTGVEEPRRGWRGPRGSSSSIVGRIAHHVADYLKQLDASAEKEELLRLLSAEKEELLRLLGQKQRDLDSSKMEAKFLEKKMREGEKKLEEADSAAAAAAKQGEKRILAERVRTAEARARAERSLESVEREQQLREKVEEQLADATRRSDENNSTNNRHEQTGGPRRPRPAPAEQSSRNSKTPVEGEDRTRDRVLSEEDRDRETEVRDRLLARQSRTRFLDTGLYGLEERRNDAGAAAADRVEALRRELNMLGLPKFPAARTGTPSSSLAYNYR